MMSRKHLPGMVISLYLVLTVQVIATTTVFAGTRLTPSFDSPKAVPRIFQPAYVPFQGQLKAYSSLNDFSDFGAEAKAIKQFSIADQKQSDFQSFSPKNCLRVVQLSVYQTSWEDPASPLNKSLGDGSKVIYQYDMTGKKGIGQLFFGLFADNSKSKVGLIGDLTKSLNDCLVFSEKSRYSIMNGNLRVSLSTSERTVVEFETTYGRTGHSKGFVSFFQVGRNLLFAGNVFRNDNGDASYEFTLLERQDLMNLQRALAADLVFQSKRKDQ